MEPKSDPDHNRLVLEEKELTVDDKDIIPHTHMVSHTDTSVYNSPKPLVFEVSTSPRIQTSVSTKVVDCECFSPFLVLMFRS